MCNSFVTRKRWKHPTKNPQEDVSFLYVRMDTDTNSQYDERIQGESQGRPIVTWNNAITSGTESDQALSPVGLEQNELNKGSQESLDKHVLPVTQARKRGWHMSYHQVKWQKWRNLVVRHKQTLFSSPRDALVERIYVEDLIAKRNVTARSYPCVCWSDSLFFWVFFASKLHSWRPNSQLTFHENLWRATHEQSQQYGKSARTDLWVRFRGICSEAPRFVQTDELQNIEVQLLDCQHPLDSSSELFLWV